VWGGTKKLKLVLSSKKNIFLNIAKCLKLETLKLRNTDTLVNWWILAVDSGTFIVVVCVDEL
jgi:hypothetical protein